MLGAKIYLNIDGCRNKVFVNLCLCLCSCFGCFWILCFILVVVFGSCCCFMFGHLNLGGPSKNHRSTKLVPPL